MKKSLLVIFLLTLLLSCNNSTQNKKETNLSYEKAIQSFKDGNYENALIEINKAIGAGSDSIHYYSLRVTVYDNIGKYKEEIIDLGKIIELNKKRNSKSVNAHHQRAVVQLQLGLYNEALSDIDYFINNRDTIGNLSEAYINKASILYKLNDIENSKKYYDLVLSENKGKNKEIESQALCGLANLSKSNNEALKLLNKAISIYNNSPSVYGARGVIYMKLKKLDLAYQDFIKALSLNNTNEINNATIHYNMGQLFANYINNNDSAIKYFENAIKISPQAPEIEDIYMNLAVIYNRLGELEHALDNYVKAEAINPKNDLLLYNYAYCLSDLNRNDEALEKITRAININEKDAEYFNLKGTILLALLSFDQAEKEFKKAIEINPKYGIALYNLGYLFGEKNDHEQSIKYYDKAVLLNFDLKATLVNRALQKTKINKISSACIDLERAYKIGRTDIMPLIDKYCK